MKKKKDEMHLHFVKFFTSLRWLNVVMLLCMCVFSRFVNAFLTYLFTLSVKMLEIIIDHYYYFYYAYGTNSSLVLHS